MNAINCVITWYSAVCLLLQVSLNIVLAAIIKTCVVIIPAMSTRVVHKFGQFFIDINFKGDDVSLVVNAKLEIWGLQQHYSGNNPDFVFSLVQIN